MSSGLKSCFEAAGWVVLGGIIAGIAMETTGGTVKWATIAAGATGSAGIACLKAAG